MATESEVTFIRCPSCRSLIPASSARCRMCGVPLEAAGAKAEEQKPQSRVRQQTSTFTPNDNAVAAPSEAASATEEDPLEELLKELENEEAENDSEEDETDLFEDDSDEEEDEEDDFDFDDDLEDEDDEEDEEEIPVKPASKSKEKASSKMKVSGDEDPLADFFTDDDEEDEDKPSKKSTKKKEKPRLYKGFAKRFVAKSKEERSERKLHKSKQKVEAPRPVLKVKTETPVEKIEQPVKVEAPVPEKQAVVQVVEAVAPVIPQPVIEPKVELNGHKKEPVPVQEASAGWVRKATKEMSPNEVAKLVGGNVDKTAVQGRLFGWLVNYATPEGQAIELREGRYFISGSKLKPTDIVIADTSISTPHALMIVSGQGGLIVQDLMSERGVFKRDRKDSAYKREHDPVALQHGDWIRFGDVEFTVAVIPHIGQLQP